MYLHLLLVFVLESESPVPSAQDLLYGGGDDEEEGRKGKNEGGGEMYGRQAENLFHFILKNK